MAPCSWEKENLRGQRKDLISHIMIAVQDLAAGSSVNYSRYRSIFSAYKEFCSDTESYPHTQMDLGSCQGNACTVHSEIKSPCPVSYICAYMQGTAPHTEYKAERLQRWHAEALRPANPHPSSHKSHNPSVNFYLTEGHDLFHWRISSSVTGLSLRVAIFSYHRDGSPQASREPWVGATEILDTSLPDIPNSSPKVQGPASVRVTSFSTRPEPSCSKWL